MHATAEHRHKVRLEVECRFRGKEAIGDPEFVSQRQFALERSKTALAAIELEPASFAQITGGSGLGEKRLVFGKRAREHRPHRVHRLDQPGRRRCSAKFQQPRRDPRQISQMVIGLGCPLEHDAQQRAGIGGKDRREDRVAFDYSGIPVRGLLAGCAPIHERHGKAALGEMQRNRGADNARSEHHRVDARHDPPVRDRADPGWVGRIVSSTIWLRAERPSGWFDVSF